MAGGQEKWYFTKEQLQNSPSRKCGLDADKELAYRQQAANLIQDMGQRLQVSQLCINTAIVYMHRFYAFHSFTQFHRNAIAAAALFLAAKVEEQPRKLEYVIKVAHVCLHRGEGVGALTSEQYQEQAQDLVFNENVLLQTLGFDVAIDHPHTHVVRTCHLVKAPKDLAQTSYFMASNSLHLTTMCLQYRPTVVACFCIHLASKWSNWAIPQSNEGRHWFSYVDRAVTVELLEKLTAEFLLIFEKCPSRLKRKMMKADGSSPHPGAVHPSANQAAVPSTSAKHPQLPSSDEFDKSFDKEYERERRRQPVPGGYVPATPAPAAAPAAPPPPMKIDYNLYREKRERERREESERRAQLQRGAARAGAGGARPAPHAPAPAKPHHAWPPHKPHAKPHEHRAHRPAPPADAPPPPRTRPPSLFSPENATTPAAAAAAPRRPAPAPAPPAAAPPQPHRTKEPRPPPAPAPAPAAAPAEAPSPRKRPDAGAAVRDMQPPAILSPFSSPPPAKPRPRPPSTSEPELVPVVKKLDETPGYENVIRESQRGNPTRVKPAERRSEPPPPPRPANGIETDPTLVSNLLKESLAKPAPITAPLERRSPLEPKRDMSEPAPARAPQPPPAQPPPPPPRPPADPAPPPPPHDDPDHKHKKEKKKKDKHKHKDRDKSKEERKKHKKDKEKEKKREEKAEAAGGAGAGVAGGGGEPAQEGALRITIPRDKLGASPGLKIKIPKERLAAPPPPPHAAPAPPAPALKIKISKEVLEGGRKRGAGAGEGAPPHKLARHNGAPPPPKVDAPIGNGHSK